MTAGPARPLTVLVTGIGALGTVFAALLKESGHRVFGLVKEKHLAALAGGRVSVSGIWGEHDARLDGVTASVGPLRAESFDLIILTVKSYDTAAAIAQVKTLIGSNTLVVVAQNGYGNYETVSGAAGREHTLLGRVIFGAKLHGPGRAEVTVIADDVRIGQPHAAVPAERIAAVAAAFTAAGIPTSPAENIEAVLWDKILYNAALNPLGALLECSYGDLAANGETRGVMDRIIDEIFAVAKARGTALNWPSAGAYRDHFYGRLVPPTARHYPSMYYDLKAGKRTEVDALNGAVVALGRELGVPAPVNEVVAALIRAKETLVRERPR